jgi:hypothetical protein
MLPRHEFVDAGLWTAVDDTREQFGQVCVRVDAVELASLNQRGLACPCLCPFIAAGERCVVMPRAIGRMLRSTLLESSSMRPSCRNRARPSQWFSA